MLTFTATLIDYLKEIIPGLLCGFFVTGLLHEIIPDVWVRKNVGQPGIKPILYATISGAILPLCAWAELPLVISFYKKGARLGPALAFLFAAPVTSLISLILMYQVLGLKFTVFVFLSVILVGLILGLIGNFFAAKLAKHTVTQDDIKAGADNDQKRLRFGERLASLVKSRARRKSLKQRFLLGMRYAFVDLAKEIGPGIFLGIVLAALVNSIAPLGVWIKHNLSGALGYAFALGVSLIMYTSANAAVILTDAFLKQGLNTGAGMVFLLVNPVFSYATILVLKKIFGTKILLIYMSVICILALTLGYIFSFL